MLSATVADEAIANVATAYCSGIVDTCGIRSCDDYVLPAGRASLATSKK
jgi:hypothetical protein